MVAKRITYLAANLLQDDLPSGFDMVLLGDVGSFSDILFRKIHEVLNVNGHLVVVDKFAPTKADPPLGYAFRSMPRVYHTSGAKVHNML